MNEQNNIKIDEKDEESLTNLVKSVLNSNKSRDIKYLNNLIWNAIYIKEKRPEKIASESRWDIENMHYYLLKDLINFLPEIDNDTRFIQFQRSNYRIKPRDEADWKYFLEKADWPFFEENLYRHKHDHCFANLLAYPIFKELQINETSLIHRSRKLYRKISQVKHPNENNSALRINEIKSLFKISFLLFLLYENVTKIINDFDKTSVEKLKKLEKFSLNQKFPYIASLTTEKLVDFLINIVLGEKQIRNLLFEHKIFTNHDIQNHTFLQNYFPFTYIERYEIGKKLDAKKPQNFRVQGPNLIDFQKGHWVYIPPFTEKLKNQIHDSNSILIQGKSGSGKSIIARYLGYEYLSIRNRSKVFYFDWLDINDEESKDISEYLLRNLESFNKQDFIQFLFIFDNVHSLDPEIIKDLIRFKKQNLCIFVQRLFDTKINDKTKESEIFSPIHSEININVDFNAETIFLLEEKTITEIKKGIIDLHLKQPVLKEQFEILPVDNLWIFAFILRLTKKIEESKRKITLSQLLSNRRLILKELKLYYIELLKRRKANISYRKSQIGKIITNLHLLMIPLSIFSEHELWISKQFIDEFFNEKHNFMRNAPFDKEILAEIIEFLVEIREIKHRNITTIDDFSIDEYRIPHSRLAKIYRNLFLSSQPQSYIEVIAFAFRKNVTKNIFSLIVQETTEYNHEKKRIFFSHLEEILINSSYLVEICHQLYKLRDNELLFEFLGNILTFMPKLWKHIVKYLIDEYEINKSKWSKYFQKLEPHAFIYYFIHIMEFADSGRRDKFLREIEYILENIISEFQALNLLNLYYNLIHLSVEFNKFDNESDQISGKLLSNMAKKVENRLINSSFDQIKTIFPTKNSQWQNGAVYEELQNNRSTKFQFLYNLFEKLYNKHFLKFDFGVFENIISRFDHRLRFLKRKFIDSFEQNSEDQEFWDLMEEKFKDITFYQIKGFIHRYYNTFKSYFPNLSSKFIIKFFHNEYNYIIHKILSDKMDDNWTIFDLVVDFYDMIDITMTKNKLSDHKILKDFNWIYALFRKLSIPDAIRLGNEAYRHILKQILKEERSASFHKKFLYIIKQRIMKFDYSSASDEKIRNIISKTSYTKLDFVLKWREKLILLYLENMKNKKKLSFEILDFLTYEEEDKYLLSDFFGSIVNTSNETNIYKFLIKMQNKYNLYGKFINFYREILERKFKDKFPLIKSQVDLKDWKLINDIQREYREGRFIKIIKEHPKLAIEDYKVIQHFLPQFDLTPQIIENIIKWLIKQPFLDFLKHLLCFHFLHRNFLDFLENTQKSRKLKVFQDPKNMQIVQSLLYLRNSNIFRSVIKDNTISQENISIGWNIEYIDILFQYQIGLAENFWNFFREKSSVIDTLIIPNKFVKSNHEVNLFELYLNTINLSNLTQISYFLLNLKYIHCNSHGFISLQFNNSSLVSDHLSNRFDYLIKNLKLQNTKELLNFENILSKYKWSSFTINLYRNNFHEDLISNLKKERRWLIDKLGNCTLFGFFLFVCYIYQEKSRNEFNLQNELYHFISEDKTDWFLLMLDKYSSKPNFFQILNLLFEFLKRISYPLGKKIWFFGQEYFRKPEFMNKLEEERLSEILEFYFRYNSENNKLLLTKKEIVFIKNRIRNSTFKQLWALFQSENLSNKEILLIKDYFWDEILSVNQKIIKPTIQCTIDRSIFNSKAREKNTLRSEIRSELFLPKLKEKYFYE